MTHEDARLLLAAYALGALDAEVEALEEHVQHCELCRAELAAYTETTEKLGEAVYPIAPPAALRAAVLAHLHEPETRRSGLRGLLAPTGRRTLTLALAVLVAAIALAAVVIQQQRIQAMSSELALNSRGLELLTSTEVVAQRLSPVFDPGSQAHGHWYHRPGVDTQVIVVEFLPQAAKGEAYYAWLRHADGSWSTPGALPLYSNGYGRLIVLGSDGTDVTGVVVTRQSAQGRSPGGEVMLRWP